MAKCIQLADKQIVRLSDDEAFKTAFEEKGSYCPKSLWKESRQHDEKPKRKPRQSRKLKED